MNKAVLTLQSLSTGYGKGKRSVLIGQQLNGQLYAGSLTALIGPNGCGKSTLLRTICGFMPPMAGTICLQDKELSDYSPIEIAQQLSIVLTDKPDTDYLTVYETIALGRMPYADRSKAAQTHAEQIIDWAMQQTECEVWRHRRLNSLSDGERQRVMVAKALAQETPLILLDEPTAFLDFPGKIMLLRLLVQLARQENKAILMSTHDLEQAFQQVHQLWLLSPEGILSGTPQQLAQEGYIQRFFQYEGMSFDAQNLRFQLTH